MHGFCVAFFGEKNEIHAGRYRHNLRSGNWMKLAAKDLEVLESGWYQNGHRVDDMKVDEDDSPYFTAEEIFVAEPEGEDFEEPGAFKGEIAKFNPLIGSDIPK